VLQQTFLWLQKRLHSLQVWIIACFRNEVLLADHAGVGRIGHGENKENIDQHLEGIFVNTETKIIN